MGCASSHSTRDGVAKGRKKRKSAGIAMVAVFVSSLRVPVSVDLIGPMRGLVSQSLLDTVSALRTRIGLLADQRSKIRTCFVFFCFRFCLLLLLQMFNYFRFDFSYWAETNIGRLPSSSPWPDEKRWFSRCLMFCLCGWLMMLVFFFARWFGRV